MIIPRPKYTWLAEFSINSNVSFDGITNLSKYITNGKLYLSLKSVQLPTTQFKNEKLRQYNQDRNVLLKAEQTASAITFFDDSASMVAALIKEYWTFYHETGDIGHGTGTNVTPMTDRQSFGIQNPGNPIPQRNDTHRPSLGLRLRRNANKYFFNYITVYDYGTDPDSINIYTYNNPTFVNITRDTLDWEDRTGKPTVTLDMEYEGYWFLLGQSRQGYALPPLSRINHGANVGKSVASDHALQNTIINAGYDTDSADNNTSSNTSSSTSSNPANPGSSNYNPNIQPGQSGYDATAAAAAGNPTLSNGQSLSQYNASQAAANADVTPQAGGAAAASQAITQAATPSSTPTDITDLQNQQQSLQQQVMAQDTQYQTLQSQANDTSLSASQRQAALAQLNALDPQLTASANQLANINAALQNASSSTNSAVANTQKYGGINV